ncbi:MAG TPA: hypothetical protein VFY71_00960 [Planctomycetota bacterium]|nr:hypothetical protein [Planctomycetota bacterium]
MSIGPRALTLVVALAAAPAVCAAPQDVDASSTDSSRSWMLAACGQAPIAELQRPFDPSWLDAGTSDTPEMLLARLDAELLSTAQRMRDGDPSIPWHAVHRIAGPLALLAWRFHAEPQALAAFLPLGADAEGLLAESDSCGSPLARPEEDVEGQLFRWLLLELSGRRDAAEARLATIEIVCHGCCGNAVASMERDIDLCRAYAAVLRGDHQAALTLLVKVESSWAGPAGPVLDEGDEASPVLLGLLLLEAGRDAEGVCLLQRLVDLDPASTCGRVARAALVQVDALRQPDFERIAQTYLEGRQVYTPDQRWALAAIGALRDPRARSMLEQTLARNRNTALIWESAWGLMELTPDDPRPLRRALQRISKGNGLSHDLDDDALDQRLRTWMGDGPVLTEDATGKDPVARQWLRWLAVHLER